MVLKGQQGLPRWSRGYTTFPMQRARGTGWGTKTPHAAQCGQKKKGRGNRKNSCGNKTVLYFDKFTCDEIP